MVESVSRVRGFSMKRLMVAALVLGFAHTANAQHTCSVFDDAAIRLACYDNAFPRPVEENAEETAEAPKRTGPWLTDIEKSEFKDTTDVFMITASKGRTQCKTGGKIQPIALHLRCMENTTAIVISGDCHLTSGHGGYGVVDIRIDDDNSFQESMEASTTGAALGHWAGGTSIPLIKRLLGAESVLMRFTPYGMNPKTVEFDVSGLDEAIKPLRESCGW